MKKLLVWLYIGLNKLKLEKFKWDYGRKPKSDKVFKTIIKLPVKNINDEEPDWEYMEEYMQSGT